MTEYIKRENVMAILNGLNNRENGNKNFLNEIDTAKEIIENLASEDVAEVVRCGKCRYKTFSMRRIDGVESGMGCGIFSGAKGWPKSVTENDFCSFGKKEL